MRRTSEDQNTGGTLVSSVHSSQLKMKFSWSLAKEALVQHARPGLALRGVVHTVPLHEQGLVVQDLLRHPQGRLQDSLLIANVVSKALANKANNCKSSIFSNSPRKSTVKITLKSRI